MGEETESRLWEHCLSGDGRAFASLFDLHYSRLFRAALRTAATRTDAEDIVATAFLELWRRRRNVRIVDGSVLPWMLVTVNNLCLNATRALNRHRRFLASLPRPVTEGAALDQVEEIRAERDAMRLLLALPPNDAAIIALFAFEGMSAAEAGSALGISADSARARLARARRRAQMHLSTTASFGERTLL